jgi:hypothetical protein
MTQISQRISAGHDAERIEVTPVHATDEFGQLTTGINALAMSLEQTERRPWRSLVMWRTNCTPITTFKGYLEGVIEPTPRT